MNRYCVNDGCMEKMWKFLKYFDQPTSDTSQTKN
jgi:hypothetical protein